MNVFMHIYFVKVLIRWHDGRQSTNVTTVYGHWAMLWTNWRLRTRVPNHVGDRGRGRGKVLFPHSLSSAASNASRCCSCSSVTPGSFSTLFSWSGSTFPLPGKRFLKHLADGLLNTFLVQIKKFIKSRWKSLLNVLYMQISKDLDTFRSLLNQRTTNLINPNSDLINSLLNSL